MIGQTISHYRIVSQLGVGGMGVVYAAHDPRLNRQVALKFVPEELAHDSHALDRLRTEARAASALNHPNICTIYDIGEHNGRPFIVMELLKGITLRDRLASRPIKVHEAVEIAIQVADALYWAHSKDVIHRDIKPANLFLVEHGQVKILDFGLAKFVVPPQGAETLAPTIDLTAAGVTLGTVAYMSPEQVAGETLDRRTDLFSLGVVLYECVTGRQPFTGRTSAVVLSSILTQAPTAPVVLNGDVPERLQEVINACLEKDRELRYQDAAGLRADLKRVKRDLDSAAMKSAALVAAEAVGPAASSGTVATIAVPLPADQTKSQAPVTRASKRGWMIGAAAGVIAVAAVIGIVLAGRRTPPAPLPVATSTPEATPAPAPVSPEKPASADDSRARFDQSIVEANRLLAAGDSDGATRALNQARALDPGSPLVADLSARLVEQFRAQADARRASAEAARASASRRSAPTSPAVDPTPQRGQPPPPPSAALPPPAAAPAAPEPQAPAITPPPTPAIPPRANTADPTPVPQPSPQPAEPTVEKRAPAPPPAAQAEDDDAAIRRVVATYARAIEGKDIGLFRSVKPNMTAAEQRRIEEGFRAVASQRVDVTILGIDRRGQEGSVRLRRRDVIQVGGRQQTADSQQTMTLTKTAAGWVIRDLGR